MKYKVIVDIPWGDRNIPIGHPNNSHTGNMFLITHNKDYSLFEIGDTASNGIIMSAEYGVIDELLNEAYNSQGIDKIYTSEVIMTPGIKIFNIDVDPKFPLLSFTTMLAPSPDWFTGINNINLLNNKNVMFPLYAYDAGSAYGNLFITEPKYHTKELSPITYKLDAPFFPNGNVIPVGYISIKKM